MIIDSSAQHRDHLEWCYGRMGTNQHLIRLILAIRDEGGIKLGIEPLHPMYAAERAVFVTLDQANTLAEKFDPLSVGGSSMCFMSGGIREIWDMPDDELLALMKERYMEHV